jgi:hypothetical protein
MSREERDLTIRWIRQLRHEPMSPALRMRCMPRNEALLRRLKQLDPRALPSAPSPRELQAASAG